MIEPSRIEVIDDATAAMFRAMTPYQRAQVASNAHRSARTMITSVVKQLHPDWNEDDVLTEVYRRMTGDRSTRRP